MVVHEQRQIHFKCSIDDPSPHAGLACDAEALPRLTPGKPPRQPAIGISGFAAAQYWSPVRSANATYQLVGMLSTCYLEKPLRDHGSLRKVPSTLPSEKCHPSTGFSMPWSGPMRRPIRNHRMALLPKQIVLTCSEMGQQSKPLLAERGLRKGMPPFHKPFFESF